jgi:hypothetical protein
MSEPIEITLPQDSIFRKLFGSQSDTEENVGAKIGEVEKTLTDDEYHEMLKAFLERGRREAEHNKPINKLHRAINKKADERKRVPFGGLKRGFLTAE